MALLNNNGNPRAVVGAINNKHLWKNVNAMQLHSNGKGCIFFFIEADIT